MIPRYSAALCLFSALSLCAEDYLDQDGDGFLDVIEARYSGTFSVVNPDVTPAHGVPIMIGQVEATDPVQRFPELDNAVAIDAGGVDDTQYVLILKGDGRVASYSLFAAGSIESKLYFAGGWQGTHPREWRGIVEIEVAPFGLFGIDANGAVHMCGEPWAVNAVEGLGDLRQIETSYDSLIGITRGGQVETATNGWTAPAVPDLSESETFWGDPVAVAAGEGTFWVAGSVRGIKGWGLEAALAKMDYSSFEGAAIAGIHVSPAAAAGVVLHQQILSALTFGQDSDGFLQGRLLQSVVVTPGMSESFSSVSGPGYESQAQFDSLFANAPDHWQFQSVASSDSALFGILRDGSPLEWAVADALGQNSPAFLDEYDWQNVSQLDLQGLPIASLEGIEQATDLNALNIEGTNVRDLSPLKSLTGLNQLYASQTPVLDLSPVGGHVFQMSRFDDTSAAEVWQELRTALGYQLRRTTAESLARNDFSIGQTLPTPPAWWHQFDADLAELVRLQDLNAPNGLNGLTLNVIDSTIEQAAGLELTSLKGVELLSELRTLTVPDQQIVDIGLLADLPYLETVDLSNNPVADLSVLLRLHFLQVVDISDSGAAELLDSASEDMPVRRQLVETLAELERRGVSVTNSSGTPRDDWQLHFEAQTAAALRDELNLSTASLTFDDLEGVLVFAPNEYDFEITDLSGLQYAWKLQTIVLRDQKVNDLTSLKDLPHLSSLRLQHYFIEDESGRLSDVSPLEGHPSLEHIDLNGTNVLDIRPLVNLPQIQSLELNDTFFADLVQLSKPDNPMAQLARMTVNRLEASGVPVYTGATQRDDWWRVFEPVLGHALRDAVGDGQRLDLNDLENAQWLSLQEHGIRDLSGVELMYQLEDLNLSGNSITNLNPLAGLSALRTLDLSDNPLADIEPLLNLNELQNVNLNETAAAELVYGLGYYSGSAVGRVQADIESLRRAGVSVNDQQVFRNDWWWQMDPTLAACIMDEVGASGYELSLNHLLSIRTLQPPSEALAPIEELNGIEYLMGLEDLYFPNQLITDLSPLSWLTRLDVLDLSNPDSQWAMNRIWDLTPLAGNQSIRVLQLSNTDVLELESLVSFGNLDSVILEGTFADDLWMNGGAANPYAQRVQAVGLQLGGVLNIAGVSRDDWWRVFDPAFGAELAEIEGDSGNLTLSFLENLQGFSAAEKGIHSVDHIGLLYSLETLGLSSNPIVDLSPLTELKHLRDLSLDWVGLFAGTVLDIEPLASIRSLEVVSLSDNPLLDIEPLLSLPLLDYAYLYHTYVSADTDNPSYWAYNVLNRRGVTVGVNQVRDDWSPLFDLPLAVSIAEQLGRFAGASFSLSDLRQLTTLSAEGAGIGSLEGLELAENLEYLYLKDNYITDLSPLESLTKLEMLTLGTDLEQYPQGNLFHDLSPLVNLWSLQQLDLQASAATDFSVLLQLPSLEQVNLQNTVFQANLDVRDALHAQHISFSEGGAVDYSRILAPSLYAAIIRNYGQVDLNRSDLYLDQENITSLEGIHLFAQLEHLSLQDNEIRDLSPLEGMPELREIDLDNNDFYLYYPELYGNQIRDISVLATLPKLEVVEAQGNLISDISPLLDCMSLRTVYMRDNFILWTGYGYESPDDIIISRIEERGVAFDVYSERDDWYRIFKDPVLIEHFEYARGDAIRQTNFLQFHQPIYDLTGLGKCYDLQTLILRESYVQDLSPLASLTRLEELRFDRGAIEDVRLLTDLFALQDMASLRTLTAQNQGIRDISVLTGFPRLQSVDLSGNYLDLRLESATGTLIESLQGQVIFTLDDQRDIWGSITDVGLEHAIRNRLGINANEAITQNDWEQLSSLSAAGYGIEDISQLSLAENLTDLTLVGNRIDDVSDLSSLNSLETLNLGNYSGTFLEMENQIDDLTSLANLHSLTSLNLSRNQVADVSPLLRMRRLEFLQLDGNPLDLQAGSDTVRLLSVLEERGTEVIYDDRYRMGQNDGVEAVKSNPNAFYLYTGDQLRGLAVGKPTLERVDDQFQLKLDVYESVDLIEWLPSQGSFQEVDGQLIWKPLNAGDTLFYTIEAQ